MTEIIRRRFDKRIKKFDWLDEYGVQNAKEKIASVVSFVADFDHSYHKIEAAYKNVSIAQPSSSHYQYLLKGETFSLNLDIIKWNSGHSDVRH